MQAGTESGPKLTVAYNCYGCKHLDEVDAEYSCVHPDSPAGTAGTCIRVALGQPPFTVPTPIWCPYPRSRVS